MRNAIDSIKTLYDLCASEQQGQATKAVNSSSSSTQTSPLLRNHETKRKHEEPSEIPAAKRRTPDPAPKAPAWGTTDVTLGRHKDPKGGNEEPGWQKVTKRKRRNRKPQKKKSKPDAIVIATRDNTSYADILRKVKTNPKLGELGENVTKIRRTVKGERGTHGEL